MSQTQLCECGQPSGSNWDCMTCRFVATETSLRAELAETKAQARAVLKRVAEAGGINVELAHVLDVCRLCGEKARPRTLDDGGTDTVELHYGREYAHASCLAQERQGKIDQAMAQIETLGKMQAAWRRHKATRAEEGDDGHI